MLHEMYDAINVLYQCLWYMNVMNAHVSWWAVFLRIDESWMAGDKSILTAAGGSKSLTAAGWCKNFWLLRMRHPYWLLLGNQELGLYANLLGIPVLRRSSLGEYLNTLWGTENESLHSAWGLIVGSFSSAGDCKNLLIAAGTDLW